MKVATWSLCISCVLLVLLACVVQCMRATSIMELRVFKRLQCRVPAVCMPNTTIPKVIYRTAKTKTLTPAHQEAWDFTAKHNPEFQQVLLDDDDADAFMRTAMNGYAYDAYRALVPGAAKADLLRYVLMYVKGGVYLDIKSGARELCRLIRPGDQMLVSTWSTKWSNSLSIVLFAAVGKTPVVPASFGELEQWWLVCAPGHPVMQKVVQEVVTSLEERKRQGRLQKEAHPWLKKNTYAWDVLNTTGPYAFTRVVTKAFSADEPHVRLVCADANATCLYDVAGTHQGAASYGDKGLLLRP